jgi:MFS family permease
VGLVMAEIAVLATLTWAGPALARSFALPPDRVGAIMATVVLISGLLGPVAGGFAADMAERAGGPRRTMWVLGAMALLSIPASTFAVLPSAGAASVALVLSMTLVGSTLVTGISLFTVVIPNELRGLCIAVLAGAQVLFGVGLAPVMVSALSGAFEGPTAIAKALACVCLLSSCSAAATFAFGIRYFPASAAQRGRTEQ